MSEDDAVRLRVLRRVLADILHGSRVAGNGGYVADIGPLTMSRIISEVEQIDPEHPTLVRWRR